jgi:hypothetical protein
VRFAIFVIDDESRSGSDTEMAAIDEFNEMLVDNGHLVLAGGLESPRNSWLIDNRVHVGRCEEGSLFESIDFYSGIWIIDAPDLLKAQELAQKGSLACNRRVELRPFL